MPCYSPLKGFVGEGGKLVFKHHEKRGGKMEVACGQCLGCRLDKSRDWAARMVHESTLHEENSFITLTYDDKHLPKDGSLNKKHFQKFVKRLRQKIAPKRVRYYQCGEYGDELGRPHYHACLFGLDFEDKEWIGKGKNYILYTSKMLTDTWGLGFTSIGEFNFQTAAYCARYIMKKITGPKAEDHYMRWDENGVVYWLEPEYCTMSRRPGIGKDWYEKFKNDLYPSDEVPVPGYGVYNKVPRYYDEILEAEDPDTYEEIKRLRKQFYFAHGEDYTPERLMQKYKVKKAQIKSLKRGLE